MHAQTSHHMCIMPIAACTLSLDSALLGGPALTVYFCTPSCVGVSPLCTSLVCLLHKCVLVDAAHATYTVNYKLCFGSSADAGLDG